MKKALFSFLTLFFLHLSRAQVAVNSNGSNPASTAMLDVSSTNKGMLLPRMTSAQRKAITNPDMGLLVYDTDRQTIYLFDGMNWKPMMVTLDHNLPLVSRTPEGITSYSEFGASVDIYDNYAVVGAPMDTANQLTCGTAYIYYKENGAWKLKAKLWASNAANYDRFGASVSIYNDLVVIGAPDKTISGAVAKGRVYVFKRTGHVWTQVVGLQASNGAALDRFGHSVSIDNNRIIAGAPYTDHSGKTNAGSAYLFELENNTWVEKKIFQAVDPVNHAYLGFSVDLSGTTAVAGATGATAGGIAEVGAVYTFQKVDVNGSPTWVSGIKLEPDNKMASMEFGYSLDIENDIMLIGAPSFTIQPTHTTGIAYQYKKTNGQWSTTLTFSPTEASLAGTGLAITGNSVLFGHPGWEGAKGKVLVVPAPFEYKQIYDEDRAAARYFGRAIAAHNGQFIIAAPGYADKGAVFFGIID